jgi:hypothetical protein
MIAFQRDTQDRTGAQAPAHSLDYYIEEMESAAMVMTFATSADLPEADRKAIYRQWLDGTFNAASHGLDVRQGCGAGMLIWEEAENRQHNLIYETVTGARVPLGRVYYQPNGTWAALVVAGVKDSLEEAQAAAELAVARLATGK